MTTACTKWEVPVEVVADLSPSTSSRLPWLLLPLYPNLLAFEDVSFDTHIAPEIDGTILPSTITKRQLGVVKAEQFIGKPNKELIETASIFAYAIWMK